MKRMGFWCFDFSLSLFFFFFLRLKICCIPFSLQHTRPQMQWCISASLTHHASTCTFRASIYFSLSYIRAPPTTTLQYILDWSLVLGYPRHWTRTVDTCLLIIILQSFTHHIVPTIPFILLSYLVIHATITPYKGSL